MIQKFKKGNDLIDVICGEVGNIEFIHYYTDNINDFAEGDIRERIDDDTIEVFIASKGLDVLKRGQLRCRIKISEKDGHFPDNTYDKIIDNGLNCWLED